jgi:hypothetical protein
MTATQKQAWFNLGVVAVTVVTVLALIPLIGRGALGGFGLLGALGFSPLFFCHHGRDVVDDERDRAIRRKALIVAHLVFWLSFVGACMSLPAFYGWNGSVPVMMLQWSVFGAFAMLTGVMSVATLVMYEMGGGDAA